MLSTRGTPPAKPDRGAAIDVEMRRILRHHPLELCARCGPWRGKRIRWEPEVNSWAAPMVAATAVGVDFSLPHPQCPYADAPIERVGGRPRLSAIAVVATAAAAAAIDDTVAAVAVQKGDPASVQFPPLKSRAHPSPPPSPQRRNHLQQG